MKSPLTMILLLICVAAIAVQAQTPLPASPEPDYEVLRTSTSLVVVPAIVKTRQGAYIPNLRRENFRVYEDGIEQEISNFEAVDAPFTVILMLDASDSTRVQLTEIQKAALAFLNQLRPADRAMIVAFDRQFSVLATATGDHKVLSGAINRVQTGGSTAIYDAIDTTLTAQLRKIPGRKAVVILSDGVDTASVRATNESTLRAANEQYALIYPIQYDSSASRQPDQRFGLVTYTTPSGEPLDKAFQRATRYLRRIAEISGGRFHASDSIKNLENSFSQIAAELRQQYSVSYYPKNQNPKSRKHKLKIVVDVPDAVIHARDSYVYRPDTP